MAATKTAGGVKKVPKNRGTGFEDYFADPPMTPKEAEEEKYEVYALALPFEDRIQSCVQRYRGHRRITGDLIRFFEFYLFLGGVDYQSKAFQGTDPSQLKEMTPAERREATATDVVHGSSSAGMKYFNGNYEEWKVDFAGVAAGYFSTSLPEIAQCDLEKMLSAIGMVENFLRYVQYHNVCPEYQDNIEEALKICSQARIECPMWLCLQSALPGTFNIAAVRVFAEHKGAQHEELNDQNYFDLPENFDHKIAFYSAITLMDDHKVLAPMLHELPNITRAFDCTLLVKEIHRPCDSLIEQFEDLVIGEDDASAGVAPVGKAILVLTDRVRDGFDHPAMPEPIPRDTPVTLYFDDEILQNLLPGMKMELRLVETENGFRFVQRVIAFYQTFHVFLPQELMRQYREVRENDRPAPSIHTKGVDEEDEEAGEGEA